MKVRSRQLETEAYQWHGRLREFVKFANSYGWNKLNAYPFFSDAEPYNDQDRLLYRHPGEQTIEIGFGDWIVRGSDSRFLVFKNQDFVRLYDVFGTENISATAAQLAVEKLSRYFTSGNDVPVERAIIKTTDFKRILAESIAQHNEDGICLENNNTSSN